MITVSSTIPPVTGCRRQDRVEWLGGSEEREEGVIDSRNGVAAGPEKRCCTLKR